MKVFIEEIKKSFEDFKLSSSEKKALKAEFRSAEFSEHDIKFIKSQLFDFAKTKVLEEPPVFVIDWLEQVIKILDTNAPQKAEKSDAVYFSPGNDCQTAILNLIHGAKQNIQICVFTISDNELTDAILAAQRRGIDVQVISDNDKQYDLGSDIGHLESKGVPLQVDFTSNHMHHKFMIVDKDTVLTGSYNWTRSAMTRNQENILITRDQTTVNAFEKEFDRLWNKFSN